ncbi:MAG: ABC transporter permease [Bacteriovorax sp.]|nr:ABC transporter permease [Bacteriovorax sp.]
MTTMYKAQWKAMIKDTILKELRSKTLIFIFIATTLMIFLSHQVLKMFISSNEGSAVMINGANSLSLMFTMINAWSVIIAGIFGISSIRSDFEDKIIYQYLAFPISRTQYMFSRIFGTWILVFGYYLYSYILSAILFSMATHSFALHWGHLVSMLLMGLYVFLVIFISFLYSMVAGKIGAFLMLLATVGIISISTSSIRALAYSEYFKDLNIFKLFGLLVYFFLPRLNFITELASSFLSKEEIKLNLGLEALHLVATSALFIFLANRLVKKRNF